MMNKIIRLTNAQSGMRVAIDVCDDRGTVLLAAGSVLTEQSLASLVKRGVNQFVVSEAISEEQRAQRIVEIDQRLEWLFRYAGDNRLLGKLRETVRAHRVETL